MATSSKGLGTGITVGAFNHLMHDIGGNVVAQTKRTTLTIKFDENPFVLNESKNIIHFKPESTSEALPLGPGQKTYELVDGINVRVKVYKVTDGYTSVTVKANFDVYMNYSNSWFYESAWAIMRGGLIQRSDISENDKGWDNLFNIKK